MFVCLCSCLFFFSLYLWISALLKHFNPHLQGAFVSFFSVFMFVVFVFVFRSFMFCLLILFYLLSFLFLLSFLSLSLDERMLPNVVYLFDNKQLPYVCLMFVFVCLIFMFVFLPFAWNFSCFMWSWSGSRCCGGCCCCYLFLKS